MVKVVRTLLPLLLAVSAAGSAFAFTMEPITALLAPNGAGSVATFRIKGDAKDRVAIRFRVLSRDMGPDGTEINAPADDLFVVYPSRLLLAPGTQAAVKVQWKGPPGADAERCFRFIAEQLPLDGGETSGSAIHVMFRYIASLYVGTTDFKQKLVATATGALGPDGRPGYLVRIDNTGTRHVVAADLTMLIGSTPFSSEELGELAGANYLPGKGRSLFIASPGADQGRSYETTLDFEAAY